MYPHAWYAQAQALTPADHVQLATLELKTKH
jgi:hypothetical protein